MNFKSWSGTPLQRILCLAGVCLFCILFDYLPTSLLARSVQVKVDETSPRFSASRALNTIREFVAQFPTRRFGSLESRQATGYLAQRLTAMGYEVEFINFDGRIGGGQQAGRNVLGYKQGELANKSDIEVIIAVTAHYDTARPTIQGAAKNGAAVGVLMELAELFSEENTRLSLLFVFTDGGEWGSTGAKDLILNYEKKDRIGAVLTLDYIAPGDLGGFRLDTIGQSGGSTPTVIRELAKNAVKKQTLLNPVKTWGTELLEKVFMISNSEQGPFLKAGIPAINLGSFSTDMNREKAIIHSSEDTIENLKIETIDKYGRAAEQIVRSFIQLPESYFKAPALDTGMIRERVFVVLFMIPALFLSVYVSIKGSRKILNFRQTARELAAFFAAWIPFLVLFLGIRLAYAARQFPFYDLYPAVAKDPVMQNPPWKVLAIIATGVLFVAIAVWIAARYFLREWAKPDYRNSYTVLWCILTLTVFPALLYNPFWAAIFFAPPVILWSMPQVMKNPKSDAGKKILNITCVAASAVPACIAFCRLAAQLGFGWNFFWYQALALTTGLFSPAAYFMGTAVIAVGIRFIVLSNNINRTGW